MLGGGYIGVEIAQILNSLGVKVTLITRSEFLRMVDRDLMEILYDSMGKYGLDVRPNTPFTKVELTEGGMKRVHLQDGTFVEAEQVLSALGRPPCL